MATPSLAHTFHAPAAAHSNTLSLICAGVLLVVYFCALPRSSATPRARSIRRRAGRWRRPQSCSRIAAVGAAFVSDWFVTALTPAIQTLHMSQEFAGLVIVAIAGNAVENVVGVQLAARNRPDFAISVIVNSSLQVALALTPVLVFVSLLFADPSDARLSTAARARARDLGDPRRVRRQRRRVDLAGGSGADRLLRRDRGELLVGHVRLLRDRGDRRTGERDEIGGSKLDLQPATAGADEDRLPGERGLVDGRPAAAYAGRAG